MKLLKNYDCITDYYLGKANVVADSLSRKAIGLLAHVWTMQLPLMVELLKLGTSSSHLVLRESAGSFGY